MTPSDAGFKEYFSSSPASMETLEAVERHFNCVLPEKYKEFLISFGSGEGFIGENYLIFSKAEELIQFNEQYEAQEYAPGLLLFGSNGGGEGFAFDIRPSEAMKIRIVPFIGMSLEHAIFVAPTFESFLAKLAKESPFKTA